jgi:hypothetical protein
VKVAPDGLAAENIPLKPAGLAPVIRTGCPARKLTVLVVVTVTVPELQLMLLIEFKVWRPKSTMESDPAPPGVDRAQFSLAETAM